MGASAVLGMRVPKWASVLVVVPFDLKGKWDDLRIRVL